MLSGMPPWKHLGIDNPIMLYNHIKEHAGPPPMNESIKSAEEAAFTAMITKCFHKNPSERLTANELLEDVFFLQGACCSDDEHTRASNIPASPGQNTSIAWESLLSPSTPQSRLSLSGRNASCRRSNSARCLRSPFMSPPIPENGILNCALIKSPAPSPKFDPSGWPSWAREHYRNREKSATGGPVVTKLAETMGSMAISDDSSRPSLDSRRNLFNSGYYSEITDSSLTLHGECLVDSNGAQRK